jgi:hypothetical protein
MCTDNETEDSKLSHSLQFRVNSSFKSAAPIPTLSFNKLLDAIKSHISVTAMLEIEVKCFSGFVTNYSGPLAM